MAAVIDIGGFNLLRLGPLDDKVLTAKAISAIAATIFAYFANRHWTWADRARSGLGRELGLFFAFNAIGLVIAEGCLFLSHYALDLQTHLADNISANVIGLGLGTAFRFWSYRRWVFPEVPAPEVTESVPASD